MSNPFFFILISAKIIKNIPNITNAIGTSLKNKDTLSVIELILKIMEIMKYPIPHNRNTIFSFL